MCHWEGKTSCQDRAREIEGLTVYWLAKARHKIVGLKKERIKIFGQTNRWTDKRLIYRQATKTQLRPSIFHVFIKNLHKHRHCLISNFLSVVIDSLCLASRVDMSRIGQRSCQNVTPVSVANTPNIDPVFGRIHIVHDEVKDKNFILELSWVGESMQLNAHATQ